MPVRNAGWAPVIDSQGEQTDPTTSTVMADTGALVETGHYEVRVTCGAEENAQFLVQHRNAANDGNVSDAVTIYTPADASGQYLFEFHSAYVGERFRVMMQQNLSGVGVVYIAAKKVG